MTQAYLKKKKHLAAQREQKFLDLSKFIITLLKKECEREIERERERERKREREKGGGGNSGSVLTVWI